MSDAQSLIPALLHILCRWCVCGFVVDLLFSLSSSYLFHHCFVSNCGFWKGINKPALFQALPLFYFVCSNIRYCFRVVVPRCAYTGICLSQAPLKKKTILFFCTNQNIIAHCFVLSFSSPIVFILLSNFLKFPNRTQTHQP